MLYTVGLKSLSKVSQICLPLNRDLELVLNLEYYQLFALVLITQKYCTVLACLFGWDYSFAMLAFKTILLVSVKSVKKKNVCHCETADCTLHTVVLHCAYWINWISQQDSLLHLLALLVHLLSSNSDSFYSNVLDQLIPVVAKLPRLYNGVIICSCALWSQMSARACAIDTASWSATHTPAVYWSRTLPSSCQ